MRDGEAGAGTVGVERAGKWQRPRSQRRRLGDRDDRQSVSLFISRRASFSHAKQARRAAVGERGEPVARAAVVLYLASAEALVHQAAVELGRPELVAVIANPSRPVPLGEAWRLLPALVDDGPASPMQPEQPPWPQFAELLALRDAWAYPGGAAARRAYYRSPRQDAAYEPLLPHQRRGARFVRRSIDISTHGIAERSGTRCALIISTPARRARRGHRSA